MNFFPSFVRGFHSLLSWWNGSKGRGEGRGREKGEGSEEGKGGRGVGGVGGKKWEEKY